MDTPKTPSDDVAKDGAAPQPESKLTKRQWEPPTLKPYGSLSDVTRGISFRPLDGINNLS